MFQMGGGRPVLADRGVRDTESVRQARFHLRAVGKALRKRPGHAVEDLANRHVDTVGARIDGDEHVREEVGHGFGFAQRTLDRAPVPNRLDQRIAERARGREDRKEHPDGGKQRGPMPPCELLESVGAGGRPGEHGPILEVAPEVVRKLGSALVPPLPVPFDRLEHDPIEVAAEILGQDGGDGGKGPSVFPGRLASEGL